MARETRPEVTQPRLGVVGYLRWAWRQLTSMRTALFLLLLLAVEVLQAVLGLAQYHLGVPVPLVALHLLGASLSVAAATNVLLAVRRAPRRAAPVGGSADARATAAAAR